MSATIIQFPRVKKPDAAPDERGELIDELLDDLMPRLSRLSDSSPIDTLSYAYPSHWTDHQQYIFDHMVRDGRSVEDAAARIEAEIRDLEDAKALPYERDQLLFLARRAMSRMKKISD